MKCEKEKDWPENQIEMFHQRSSFIWIQKYLDTLDPFFVIKNTLHSDDAKPLLNLIFHIIFLFPLLSEFYSKVFS